MKARFLVLAAMMLGLASCQTEPEGLNVNVGGEVDTFVTVTIPETETRANSAEGAIQNLVASNDYTIRYVFEVYYGETGVQKQVLYSDGKIVSFPVRLVPGRDYNFVAWADIVAQPVDAKMNKALPYEDTDVYYETSVLKNITIIDNNNEWKAMDEARDAYSGFHNTKGGEKYTGSSSINIRMTRPFAKLRVITTDMEELSNLNITPVSAKVTYSAFSHESFNALDGTYSGEISSKTHTYAIADYADFANTAKEDSHKVLFTDYFFADASDVVKFELDVYEGDVDNQNATTLIKHNDFKTDIPAQRNYLTTIQGNILTDGNDITVTVENDGKFENAGDASDDAPYYKETISSAAEFLAALDKAGEFIVISDITIDGSLINAGSTVNNGQASTFATRAGGKTTIVDLNGLTITVNNQTGDALVSLDATDSLIFAGEGTIEGTGKLVEGGTVVVTGAADVDEDVADVKTDLDALVYICANGGEFTFAKNLEANSPLAVTTTKPVVINGNGKTLTSTVGGTTGRAINVSGAQNVTIKNLTINASGERAINVIQNATNITIDNVTATAANYTVNVASSAPNAVVAIKNSTLNGLCTVNVSSAEAVVTVDGSTVNCNDNNTTAGESYAALCLNKEAIGGSIIATNSTINVAEGSDSTAGRNGAEDGVVTINGSDEGVVVMIAVITYPDSSYYHGFQTIQSAVEFAKNGDVITLIRNVELTESTTVPAGKTITLDLNGKTITGTDSSTGSYAIITNKGNLTITGNGKMTLKAENNREWNAYSSVISNTVGGKLVVENGTIEHLGGTDMAYGIDNLTNGKGTYAETVINGGTIKSTYRAVRMFLNGTEAQNLLTVNGGTIEGANKSIWMQDPSKNANTGTLVVNEGAILNGDVYLFVTAGSTSWPVEVSIAASAVNGEVLTGNVPEGYAVELINGVWVVKAYDVVAAGVLMKNGEYYVNSVAGLQWIEAQKDDFFAAKTIKLMNDIDCEGAEIKPIRFWEPERPTTFDGQEHTIVNVTMNMPETDNVALFNGTAKIKNLNVDKATIVGRGYVGVIGGTLYGSLDNCHVTNSTVTGNYWQVGGLVGQYDSGDMDACSVLSTTITGPAAVGALAGIWNEKGGRTFANCKVENCTIKQNYSFGANYDTLYGVLSGCANVDNTTFTVDKCVVNNNTIKGFASETLVGEVGTGSNLVVK